VKITADLGGVIFFSDPFFHLNQNFEEIKNFMNPMIKFLCLFKKKLFWKNFFKSFLSIDSSKKFSVLTRKQSILMSRSFDLT